MTTPSATEPRDAVPAGHGGEPRRSSLNIGDLEIDVVFKAIKNVHVAVYPPDGHVRVAAPKRLTDDAVRLAVVKRLPWIRRQRTELQAAERLSEREMLAGESHYLWGRRYRLQVLEREGRPGVRVDGSRLVMTVRPGASPEQRARQLSNWERRELRRRIPELVARWETELGVSASGWGTRRMKTKWGSYSAATGRVWINTELVKKAPRCLEYIVVHELTHIRHRGHGRDFVAAMDRHLPDWRSRHHELNTAPLSAESWDVTSLGNRAGDRPTGAAEQTVTSRSVV